MKHEAIIRLACFVGVFGLLIVGELLWPRRGRIISRKRRWPNNIAVVFVDTFLARLVMPAGATGIALLAELRSWGFFNNVSVPVVLAIVASVIVLDLAIYAQHWLFHHVPWLWRLHRMHHPDLDVDVTTG